MNDRPIRLINLASCTDAELVALWRAGFAVEHEMRRRGGMLTLLGKDV